MESGTNELEVINSGRVTAIEWIATVYIRSEFPLIASVLQMNKPLKAALCRGLIGFIAKTFRIIDALSQSITPSHRVRHNGELDGLESSPEQRPRDERKRSTATIRRSRLLR